MPYSITTKDGITINNIPDDIAPDAQVLKDRVASLRGGEKKPSFMDELGRQVGLTARAGIEGAAELGGLIYDPVAAVQNKLLGSKVETLGAQGQNLANTLGLPKAQNETEQMVQAVSKGLVGTAGGIGAGAALAKSTAPSVAAVGAELAKAPAVQAAATVGATGAAEEARQSGMETTGQVLSALGGGLAAGSLAGIPSRVANVAKQQTPTATRDLIAAGEAAGVPVMTSDVLPPSTYMGKFGQTIGEKIPFVGTAGNRADQATKRVDAIKDVARAYDVHIDTPLDKQIYDSIGRKKAEQLNKFIGMKQEVIDSVDGLGVVPMNKTQAALQAEIDELTRLNVPNTESAIENLTQWRDAFGGKSFSDVEKMRKAFGESLKDKNGQIPTMLEKIPTRVYGSVKEDMSSFINDFDPAAANKWALANKRLAESIGEQKVSKFKSVIKNGDSTPETIQAMLFSSKPSEVSLIARNLDEAGKAHARTAIIKRMIDNSGGMEELSAERFKTEFKKLEPQLKTFFDADSRKQLDGTVKLLDATQRAGSANFLPKTGEQVAAPALGIGLGSFMGLFPAIATAAGIGTLARVYESAPVRNLLIKLAAEKAGSASEKLLIQKLMAVTRAANQKDNQDKKF